MQCRAVQSAEYGVRESAMADGNSRRRFGTFINLNERDIFEFVLAEIGDQFGVRSCKLANTRCETPDSCFRAAPNLRT